MQANRRTSRLEIEFRHRLWRSGVRYRLRSGLPGRPDLAFPGSRLAVFVHGCFWHACPSCSLPAPRANSEFWQEKFRENVARDARVADRLTALGWRVLVVWEHDLRSGMDDAVRRVSSELGRAR